MNPVNCSVHLHRQKSARSGPMPFTRNCHFGNTKIKVQWGIQIVNCNRFLKKPISTLTKQNY